MNLRYPVIDAIFILLTCAVSSCATGPKVKPFIPEINPSASLEERQQLYAKSQLNKTGDGISSGITFTQGSSDNILSLDQVGYIFEYSSDDIKGHFNKGKNYGTASTGFAIFGGGCIGMGLAWGLNPNLGFNAIALSTIGAGSGLLILACIFASNSSDHFDQAMTKYNSDLKNKLGLVDYSVSYNYENEMIRRKLYNVTAKNKESSLFITIPCFRF